MKTLRVASVQFEHTPGDKSANLQTIRQYVEKAAESQVQLIVFPECCISGYWHLRDFDREQLLSLAEPIPAGESCRVLIDLARRYSMAVGAGLIEVDADGTLYNSYFVAMSDGTFARHRKLHAFINEHVASGSEFTVFDTPEGWRVGLLICYDNNIVENARACALDGAEILLAPHQTGGCKSGSPHAMSRIDPKLWHARHTDPEAIEREIQGPKGRDWLMRWLPSRAHDNGMFLIFSNGVGIDDNEVRTGNSMIFDPYGRILAETHVAEDAMITTDLDDSLRDRCTGVRWMQSRRPELYTRLAQATGKERDTRAVRFEFDNLPE